MLDENDVVVKAREKSRMVLSQAQQQEADIMERTRQNSKQLQEDADRYANQVFDQLIAHVTNTFQGVQQAQAGLDHALQILQQAKLQMNQQAAQQAYAQAYGTQQTYTQPQQQYDQPRNIISNSNTTKPSNIINSRNTISRRRNIRKNSDKFSTGDFGLPFFIVTKNFLC